MILNAIAVGLLLAVGGTHDKTAATGIGLTAEEQSFNFGHVGIDYTVRHTFEFENRSADTMRFSNLHVPCDCSSVITPDSILAPGDTARFMLRYSTKDYYGPANRWFSVKTDHPDLPELKFSYLAIVGQWFHGLKPDPTALLFLPKHDTRTIRIPNDGFDRITLTDSYQQANSFSVSVTTEKATRGKALEIEVVPAEDLKRGTYVSDVTLTVEKSGQPEPTILTIPVKIVRY